MADIATINLRKKSPFGFDLRFSRFLKKIDVLVDGQKVDYVTIVKNKDLSFQIPPGEHKIRLKWFYWRSEEITINSVSTGNITLEWGAKPQYVKEMKFLLILYVVVVILSIFLSGSGTLISEILVYARRILDCFLAIIILYLILSPWKTEVYYLRRADSN